MTVLYFDCFSGASGDMVLGALIDAGVPLDEVRHALGSLAISADTVWTDRVVRTGISATKFNVRGEDIGLIDHAHDHERGVWENHERPARPQLNDSERTRPQSNEGERTRSQAIESEHHDRPHTHEHETLHRHGARTIGDDHRSLAEIHALIDTSSLSATGKDRARHLFHRLAEAESAIHGTPLDKVHLHEVGALDSIIDVVGAVHALEQLRPGRIVSSPLNVGSGTVRTAHGVYPVPAPATARLLDGVPIYSSALKAELVTPTGALLVSDYAQEYGPIPSMRIGKVGYGAGSRDFPDTPNVLRVLIGEADAAAPSHSVTVIEADIDDMSPQIFGVLMDRLLAEGALDVFYTSIQMKKNRPGTLLTVVAPPAARERLTAIVFRETTTIGVRYREMNRECMDRETVTVDTPFGPIRIKVARRNGEILNASPEFDDCVRLAAERGRPVKEVQAMASKAFVDGQIRKG